MPQDQDDIKGANAMKQAPTPGPLSGDRAPPIIHGQGFNGGGFSFLIVNGERYSARQVSDALAPPAPVEASGSEREIVFGQFQPFSDFPDLAAHIGRMGATGQLGSVTEWDTFLATLNAAVSNKEGHIPPINAATVIAYEDAHAVAVEMGYPSLTEALEHLSELRPQPSGETREGEIRAALQSLLHYCKNGAGNTRLLKTAMDRAEAALYAHPSPPPAADEDRVRRAIHGALVEMDGVAGTLKHLADKAKTKIAARSAMAASYRLESAASRLRRNFPALRSTAAQEGGE